MGSNTSKQTNDAAVVVQKNDIDIGDRSDPRSPTPEIIRTPLQGKPGIKHNITKNVDLRKTFENGNGEICEEKLIHNNPILSAVIKNHLQSYDPRSPTQDFERTPIIITSKIDDLPEEDILKQQKGNYGSPCLEKDEHGVYDSCAEAQESPEILKPKNLCNDFCDLTLNETSKLNDEPLGSSTASNEAIENNISNFPEKPEQLLETNFDYIETEADKLEDSGESNNTSDSVEEGLDYSKQIPQFKILADDPRSPSAGIERTPIVVSKNSVVAIQENVEEMSDDTLIKVLQNTNADLRQFNKPKNEGLLIYEDESSHFQDTPKKSRCTVGTDARTPLSCMKNKADVGHMRSKSANDTNDKDKVPAKARRASHIPRLKALSKQTKLSNIGSSVSLKNISKKTVVSGDCENTPPHSHRDKWDKDASIVL